MSLIDDFKKFALRGNMVDLAIGFTVGAAFTTLVKSLVNDIIMPPIGLVTGGADFADLFWIIDDSKVDSLPEGGFETLAAAQQAGAVTMNYGIFLNACLSLLIVAMAMFILIRFVNRIDEELDEHFGEKPAPSSEPSDKKCRFCRTMVPYRAIRCPQCTSELEMPADAAV